MYDIILDDLRGRFGPKVLLDPADLVEVIGISVGQQANLRSEGKFPIEVQKIGNRIKISIYALAKYLAGCASNFANNEIKASPDKLNRVQKKNKKGLLEKNWWAFRQRSIFSIIDMANLSRELKTDMTHRDFTKV